jgi:hypothetical protein
VKSLAADRQGNLLALATLSQNSPSMASIVSINTDTQNGVPENCPAT